jgi:hypothetical protein
LLAAFPPGTPIDRVGLDAAVSIVAAAAQDSFTKAAEPHHDETSIRQDDDILGEHG